jgi:cytochrome c peroxidase
VIRTRARCAALASFAAVALGSLASGATGTEARYAWQLPAGFPEPAVPRDNPMSVEKVRLGRTLFFDPALSSSGAISCSSCHDPPRAFTDGLARSRTASGELLAHNAPTLVNAAYGASFGWETPEIRTLEQQMHRPLFSEHPVEMGLAGREREVVAQLESDADYRALFDAAFSAESRPVSIDNLVRAIASYERSLIHGDSPFDRYVFRGEHTAVGNAAKRGLALFYSPRLGCANCHSGFNFTGTWNEAAREPAPPAMARNGVAQRPMRVPTLRNIALTGPYMHDGRLGSLAAVIDHYEHAGQHRADDRRLRSFTLNATERVDLLAFLESLSDAQFTADAAAGRP